MPLADGRHNSAPPILNPFQQLVVRVVNAHPERIFDRFTRMTSSREGQGAFAVSKTG